MVIYPEGVWLKVTNKKDIDLIIDKYIKENNLQKNFLIKLKCMKQYLLPVTASGISAISVFRFSGKAKIF